MINILERVRLMGTNLNIIKTMNDKPITKIILNEETLKENLLKIRKRMELSAIPTTFQCSAEILARAIRQEREITGLHVSKEVILTLFADDTISPIKDPKDFTKKHLETIDNFSKVLGYKISLQKNRSPPRHKQQAH